MFLVQKDCKHAVKSNFVYLEMKMRQVAVACCFGVVVIFLNINPFFMSRWNQVLSIALVHSLTLCVNVCSEIQN